MTAQPHDHWLEYSDAPGERDSLVSLATRPVFDRDLARATSEGESLSVIMVDIDHFKKVNDTHGHQKGDEVLVHVAATIRRVVGRRGRAYRWGGEEFFALLPGFTEGEAAAVAERLRAAIEALEFERRTPPFVTASLGVAELAASESAHSIVERVDKALYRAKSGGRNVVVASAGNYGLRSESRPRIAMLIVDDDKFIRDIVRDFIGIERGFDDLLSAESVIESFNRAAAHELTLAFVSLEMDGPTSSSSMDIVRALRARSPKARIYGVTSYPDSKRLADAVAAGVDGVIRKPFRVDDILALAAAARDGAPAPTIT